MTAVNGHELEPWRPPTDAEVRGVVHMLFGGWMSVFRAGTAATAAAGAIGERLADLGRNYGRELTAWRTEPRCMFVISVRCRCGDDQRVEITDEHVRRDHWEPVIGQLADITGPIRDHAELCPHGLRRPGRPMPPPCGVVLGCVPCQLPAGHAGKHDPAPEPPVATDDPDWAIQTPTRKDTPDG